MKRVLCSMVIAAMLSITSISAVRAGEIDILVDKLVEKGVLTPVEAQIILDETKQEVAKEVAQGKSASLPSWVQKMKLKGDLRLRYQWNHRRENPERHRFRIRFRLGLIAQVHKMWEVGAGLASGGDDPRSTNQTLENTFDTPDIRLDYAYAKFMPISWMNIIGGKMKNPLYRPSDLLWDGDINPEGAAIQLTHTPFDGLDLFANAGVFVLDEAGGETSDPYMAAFQPGFKWHVLPEKVSIKGAVTYYMFDNIKKNTLDHSAGTNSLDQFGHLMFDYDSIGASAEIAVKNPFGEEGIAAQIPYLAVFGDYIHNTDPKDANNGWLAGIKLGHKKVKKQGQWQFKYLYRRLEKDAWPDALPDSDFFDGGTGAKGHELIFSYALYKNVIWSLDYYRTKGLEDEEIREDILQSDIQLKF